MNDNTTKSSRLTAELLETVQEMHSLGLMDKAGLDKITVRHLGTRFEAATVAPLMPDAIKTLREQANMSQAAFGRLNRRMKDGDV